MTETKIFRTYKNKNKLISEQKNKFDDNEILYTTAIIGYQLT